MIANIRKIGNSKGIIIPKDILQDIGSPASVDITLVEGGILLRGVNKAAGYKPRDEDESEGFYQIMKAELDAAFESGRFKFTGEREMEIERKIEKMPVETQRNIGIDVGLSSLLTLSNGKQIEPPKFLIASEKRLTREQIELSHKKPGTNNRGKQRIKVAKVHRKIRNQRKDFAHKTSNWLVHTYDHMVFEDLQIQNMMQNHCLAKSISDAGWYQLISLTKSKAEYAGKVVELVNPRGTSQVCICGFPVPKDLSMRIHSCPQCGLVLGRDHVSAMVIESRSTVGIAGIEACQSNPNRETMKQEAPTL